MAHDKLAFEGVYRRDSRRLLLHLARRMQDLDAATELWAECWAVAFEGWGRCRAEGPGAEDAWVFGIARNLLASYYRSGAVARRALSRLQWTVPEIAPDEYAELEREAQLGEQRELLADALGRLPQRRRTAVQLRIVSGLGYGEVAARLGCSEQAARAHVSRGLRQLAELLDGTELATNSERSVR
jgi:RNA polymerase sigma factor (sigma-70 family)